MVGSRMKSGREFQNVGPTAVSVEPLARYCKQLTVGGTQVLPSDDTDGRNVVVRLVRRCAVCSIVNPNRCSKLSL